MKELTPQAQTVLERRYLRRSSEGELVETPEQLFRRVASCVAGAERNYCKVDSELHAHSYGDCRVKEEWEYRFFKIMSELDFLPNSPCLANAGKPNGQLSACFVIPVEDNLEGIFDAVKAAALIHKTGGGTGFSFNRLRPRDSLVASTGHVASGPVSFMAVFDAATNAIKQGGMRRGANMGILNVDNPDILEFIHCKDKGGVIENFNISVAITDEFMYDLVDCGASEHHKRYASENYCACKLWAELIQSAWKTGDPGLWFIDRVNMGKGNAVSSIGTIESCNPCGEQELPPWGVCSLGSINLSNFFEPHILNVDTIDWERLAQVVAYAVRFIDDVLDVNTYILPQIEIVAKGERRMGLGVMGWADLLIKLGIPYDSDEAVEVGGRVMKFIQEKADKASRELAKDRRTNRGNRSRF